MLTQFPLYLIATLSILGLAPFLLMMVTSYTKIIIVISLVRNALGVQQVPPAIVLNGLAMRGSPGEYQADVQAGVARFRWRVSGRCAGRCRAACPLHGCSL